MASSETVQIQSPAEVLTGDRKPWATPRVIVTLDPRRAEAKHHMTGGTDFHSATSYSIS